MKPLTELRDIIFTQEEVSLCRKYYQSIVKDHKECFGSSIIEKNSKITYCDCLYIYDYVKALVYARIPKRHWNVSKFCKKSMRKVDEEIINHFFELDGFFIHENELSGKGKTRTLSLMGKKSILKKKKVCYVKSKEFLLFSQQKDKLDECFILFDRIMSSDVILIDDPESVQEWQFSEINNLIKTLYDKGCSIVVGSSLKSLENFSILDRSSKICITFQDDAKIITDFFLNKIFLEESIMFSKINREAINDRGRVGIK